MKKLICLLLSLVMLFSLTACAGSNVGKTEESKQETAEFLDTDEGSLRCVSIEKANSGLCDEENVWVVTFEFTNKTAEPKECQNLFDMTFFQNNVEVDEISSYSSSGGDHYELLGNYFKETLNGGTITFGEAIILTDESPVTVFMEEKNYSDEEVKKATVVLDLGGSAEEPDVSVDADTIKTAAQGTWDLNGNKIVIEGNTISFDGGISGTFTINTETKSLDAEMKASDGIVTINLPFTYENETLKLFNNQNEELVKQ